MSRDSIARSASLASLIALVAACGGNDPVESTETGGAGGATGGGTGFTGGMGGGFTGGMGGAVTGGVGGMTGGSGGATGGIGPNLGGDTGSGGLGGGPDTGGASGTGGSSCGAGQTQCGAACVDLQADAAHCSACDDACTAGWGCVGAVCVSPSGGTTYSLELGDPATGEVLLEVSTAGGRVTTFSLDGQDLLSDPPPPEDQNNFGSTMWTSPQSAWNWPPVVAIDSAPYTASVTGNVITMTSGSATISGAALTVAKAFTPDPATSSIRIDYTITNTGGAAIELAAWEITRVLPTGYVVWPDAGAAPYGRGTQDTQFVASVQLIDQHRWVSPKTLTAQKVMADGANGWMGYAAGQMLFVKTWTDVAADQQFSPTEGEIEVYEGTTYRELEVQGPRTTLASGANLTFSVTWYLRELAAPVQAAGDSAMLAAITDIVGG